MTRDDGASIVQGLREAVAFAKGRRRSARVHRVLVSARDVRATRERLALTQSDFAAAFGVSVATVRKWEQGRRAPEGPACVLLRVIDKHPEAVLDTLKPKRRRA